MGKRMGKSAQKEQIKLYIVVALSVVAAVMAYFRFVHTSRLSAPRTENAPAADLYEMPELPGWMSSNSPPMAVDRLPYTPPRRDIFAPIAETPTKAEAPAEAEAPPAPRSRDASPREPARPRLSGIMRGAKEPQAIIDGKIVHAGEKVGVYTVSAISQSGVILTSATDRLILSVGK